MNFIKQQEQFLPPHDLEPPKEPPKSSFQIPWKKLIPICVIVLACVLIAAGAPLVYGLGRAGAAALDLRGDLKLAQTQALNRDFSGAAASLARASNDIDAVHAGLQSLGPWRSAPWVGSQVRALEQSEQAASSALSGFHDLLAVAASVQDALDSATALSGAVVDPNRSYKDLSVDEKRALLDRLYQALPQIRLGREKISIAAQAWARVPQNDLIAPIRAVITPLADRLPELDKSLGQAVDLLEWAVPLSGYPDPKNYIVILQNADELRPTGGFIGDVGLLKVDSGDIKSIDFEDVYSVDNPVASVWKDIPPAPLAQQLGVPAWFFRDSNWSPDFPTSAARLMDVYTREMKQGRNIDVHPDGVIALQPEFFRQILLLTGPIQIEDKTFNAQNFFDELQYDVEIGFAADGTPIPQRKEILHQLGSALIDKLLSLPSSSWSSLLNIATTSLNKGDILVSVKDAQTQSILDRRGWSGRMIGTDDDYLMVVDANLAALKTDGLMDKQVTYSLDATDPYNPVATVRLHYTNNVQHIDWRYTRYRSYTRVYVPDGVELVSSSAAHTDVYHELGKTVFGVFWVIEPGRSGDLVFKYKLPTSVADRIRTGPYRLTAQKQPGARRKLTLDLSFGKNVVRATPSEDEADFGDAKYRYSDDWPETESFDIEFK